MGGVTRGGKPPYPRGLRPFLRRDLKQKKYLVILYKVVLGREALGKKGFCIRSAVLHLPRYHSSLHLKPLPTSSTINHS